jgi:hypothetical protein
MSLVSSQHTIVPFIAGKTAPFTGQRLAKIGYKSTKQTSAQFPSVAVSVPLIQDTEITENSQALIPHVREFLSGVQDKVIRSLYESHLGSLSSVGDAEISVAQCIAFLNTESAGGRLTKESVYQWFDSDAKDILTALLADKMEFADPMTPDQEKVIALKVNAYREVCSSLSGGATNLQPAQIKSLRTLFGMCDSSDMLVKLNSRLDSMEQVKPVAELLEL